MQRDNLRSLRASISGSRATTFSKLVKTFFELTTVSSEVRLEVTLEWWGRGGTVNDDCDEVLRPCISRTVGRADAIEVTEGLVRRPLEPGELSRLAEMEELLAEEECLRSLSDLEDSEGILVVCDEHSQVSLLSLPGDMPGESISRMWGPTKGSVLRQRTKRSGRDSSHVFDVNSVPSGGYPEIRAWVDATQTEGRVVEVAVE